MYKIDENFNYLNHQGYVRGQPGRVSWLLGALFEAFCAGGRVVVWLGGVVFILEKRVYYK